MPTVDIYIDDDDRQRRKRRGKWLVPILVGLVAAYALGREKPIAALPPKPVVVPPPVIATAPPVVETPPVVVETPPAVGEAPPLPAKLAVGPVRLDFGDGPLPRAMPAQMAIIRNEGGQPLPRIDVSADHPFLATNGCTRELAPDSECMIAVVFAPQQPGKFAGALRIAAGADRAQIPLRGSVPRPREIITPVAPTPAPAAVQVAPPPAVVPQAPALPPARILCFQPPLVRFTTTGKQSVTLTNPGPLELRVAAVVPIGRQGQTLSGYEVEARKCLRVLKPGQQCKFTVRANELAVQTGETMKINVYYDDPITGTRRPAMFSLACGGR
jgi:hypothetical protein